MKTLQKYKNEQMKNPEFAKAYEEIQPEMNVIRAIVMDMILKISFVPKERA